MPDDLVVCPVCFGKRPYVCGARPCLCCDGAGTITRERRRILQRIRTDLRRRLAERGISVDDLAPPGDDRIE